MTNKELELINLAKNNGITDRLELAHFVAQCVHESANFTILTESLNYKAAALMATWPTRFTQSTATVYGRTDNHQADQKAIANIVYNGRMGNRVGTDDGYNFRGRGYIQLTGRDNYERFNIWSKSDCVAHPEYLAEHSTIAALSAIWFWKTNKVGVHALRDDVAAVTKLVNGGAHGLNERVALTNNYKKVTYYVYKN